MPCRVRFGGLDAWLDWQLGLHPLPIEPGLERVERVARRSGWSPPDCPVITIGGTNGKGSCVALADSILRAGGYRTGTFTSPHLVSYVERIRVQGQPVSAASLVASFERIADALGPDTLTFFEFNTLAALLIFETAEPDAIILEVGMGGRLDAVNNVDADVAVVVSLGIDHAEWLGADLESIAREKAGIFRAGRPALYGGEEPPPDALIEAAHAKGALLRIRGRDFREVPRPAGRWDLVLGKQETAERLADLPAPALAGTAQLGNAATTITAIRELRSRLPLTLDAIAHGLERVALPGRFERIADRHVEWILDVAHNPAAARVLAASLPAAQVRGQGRARGARRTSRMRRHMDRGYDRGSARSGRHRACPARKYHRPRPASGWRGRRGDALRAQSRPRGRPNRRLRLLPHGWSRARRARTRGRRRRTRMTIIRAMDRSLKARLIGASVLVLAVVLVVPELLSGRKAATTETPAAADTTLNNGPTRTYTIELGKAGSPAADANL